MFAFAHSQKCDNCVEIVSDSECAYKCRRSINDSSFAHKVVSLVWSVFFISPQKFGATFFGAQSHCLVIQNRGSKKYRWIWNFSLGLTHWNENKRLQLESAKNKQWKAAASMRMRILTRKTSIHMHIGAFMHLLCLLYRFIVDNTSWFNVFFESFVPNIIIICFVSFQLFMPRQTPIDYIKCEIIWRCSSSSVRNWVRIVAIMWSQSKEA